MHFIGFTVCITPVDLIFEIHVFRRNLWLGILRERTHLDVLEIKKKQQIKINMWRGKHFSFNFPVGYSEKDIRPSIGKGLLTTQELPVSRARCIY